MYTCTHNYFFNYFCRFWISLRRVCCCHGFAWNRVTPMTITRLATMRQRRKQYTNSTNVFIFDKCTYMCVYRIAARLQSQTCFSDFRKSLIVNHSVLIIHVIGCWLVPCAWSCIECTCHMQFYPSYRVLNLRKDCVVVVCCDDNNWLKNTFSCGCKMTASIFSHVRFLCFMKFLWLLCYEHSAFVYGKQDPCVCMLCILKWSCLLLCTCTCIAYYSVHV